MDADILATDRTVPPINFQIITSPLTVYVNDRYIYHNLAHHIRYTFLTSKQMYFELRNIVGSHTNLKKKSLGQNMDEVYKIVVLPNTIHSSLRLFQTFDRQNKIQYYH